MSSSTITDYQLPDNTHQLYQVHFYSDDIHTLVTHDPEKVAEWISEIQSIQNPNLIVGLDVEWRPNFNPNNQQRNPVATLQLCVGRNCLVFQILKYASIYNTNRIPYELALFLGQEDCTFVGVGIESDVEKLEEDYGGVRVGRKIVDLRWLAAQAYQMNRLNNAGLKELASVVLGKDLEKPREVTVGRWDNPWLTLDQVKYACIDAFVSFEIGFTLNASAC